MGGRFDSWSPKGMLCYRSIPRGLLESLRRIEHMSCLSLVTSAELSVLTSWTESIRDEFGVDVGDKGFIP